LGLFLPFTGKGGIFIAAGVGYIIGSYTFTAGQTGINLFAANFTAGINLFDMLNVSYRLKTDFNAISNKLAVGYVFRF
jgi:hypothetical protein